MNKEQRFRSMYMDIAHRVAQMSHARRLQVGSIIVKDNRIISIGYNGMPSGWDNNCEDLVVEELDEKFINVLKTKPEVLHAETNSLAKLARSNDSGLDADMFVTHAPCLDCAKLIYQSGISRVYYANEYRDTSGIIFLQKSGIVIENITPDASLA